MFTGLAEEVGRISALKPNGDGLTVEIQANDILQDVHIGDSIAVDGVCLTVVSADASHFAVDAVSETVSRTTLAHKSVGGRVNLERAMAADGRFGGHFVQGHVDGVGRIDAVEQRSSGYWLTIDIPDDLLLYIVEKGSIAIDGLSLTVAAIDSSKVSIAIIPHTWSVTALGIKKRGEKVNVEVDMVAKYIHKMVQPHMNLNGLTFDKLSQFGFD